MFLYIIHFESTDGDGRETSILSNPFFIRYDLQVNLKPVEMYIKWNRLEFTYSIWII